ncbi:hypothetical protein ACJ73_10053, partial [Blastomyces percursus]
MSRATGAKEGSPATLAHAGRQAKENAVRRFEEYWARNAPTRYNELEIPLQGARAEQKLPRFTLGKLYAARTGHGDFKSYHDRFNHEDAEVHCRCGAAKAPEHFYYCRLARRAATARRRP